MLITLIILVLSAAFFVAGKVRSDIVALCALIGLLIFPVSYTHLRAHET